MNKMDVQPRFDPIEKMNLVLAAGVVVVAWIFVSPLFAGSIALGAILEAVNFRALNRATQSMVGGTFVSNRFWMAGFSLRFSLLGIAMAVAIYSGVDPIGLVLGLTMIVPAVVVVAWGRRQGLVVSSVPVPPPDDPCWDRWNVLLARPWDDEVKDSDE